MALKLCLILIPIVSLLGLTLADGDVVGKLTVGYQGWFAIQGDGSPMNHWVHWSNEITGPKPGHQKFEIWPDVREYPKTYQTAYQHLGNGQPAKLFSSWDQSTVDVHFKWMEQYNIDTAALQRFAGGVKRDPVYGKHLDGIARNVQLSAEHHHRKFYIMWDISGWNNFATEIIEDLHQHLQPLGLFKSSAYAHQNGKPVLCIWGLGFGDRPQNITGMIHVIQELKKEGFYVIGGVDTHWLKDAHLQQYHQVYMELNMLQPWAVGRFDGVNGAKGYGQTVREDFEYLKSHHIDYQPVVFAGFAWSNWNGGKKNQIPRLHGDFMWQQFVNLKEAGITTAYVAMFDEYDEGTAIAKAAETKQDIPTDQYFLTLDADGTHVSSDFYLRLTGEGNRMLKSGGQLRHTHTVPFLVH